MGKSVCRLTCPLRLNVCRIPDIRSGYSGYATRHCRTNSLIYLPVSTLVVLWQVTFNKKQVAQRPSSVTFDTLASWTTWPKEGIHFYSGTTTYRKTFYAPTRSSDSLYLDLGDVQDVGIAWIRMNGTDLDILWTPPCLVLMGDVLKPTGNQLEIEVVNSWRNRLIGDRDKPAAQRLTQTNVTIKPDWQLQTSGLLGPVRLVVASDR